MDTHSQSFDWISKLHSFSFKGLSTLSAQQRVCKELSHDCRGRLWGAPCRFTHARIFLATSDTSRTTGVGFVTNLAGPLLVLPHFQIMDPARRDAPMRSSVHTLNQNACQLMTCTPLYTKPFALPDAAGRPFHVENGHNGFHSRRLIGPDSRKMGPVAFASRSSPS